MADKNTDKNKRLLRRKHHVRASVSGTAERPRLAVFRSEKHIYAQVIDDLAGRTLVSASSNSPELRGEGAKSSGANVQAARKVGKAIAEKAKAAGVLKVAFDRGGRRYHGRVKALADAAREAGLQF